MPQTPQQQWLKKLVGKWIYTGECMIGPGKPNLSHSGSQDIRSVGDAWIHGEMHGTMPDGEATLSILTVGHDPKTDAITGTWIGSMMPFMWHYKGTLAGDKLVLATRGPSMIPGHEGQHTDYEERITISGPDAWTFASAMKLPDGEWTEFMWMHHVRAE